MDVKLPADRRAQHVLAGLKPTPAGYLEMARLIENGDSGALRPLNVAILSTFTIEILRPYLLVEMAKRGFLGRLYFGPYSQIESQILDEGSGLYASRPDVVVVATRLEEIAPNLVSGYASTAAGCVEAELSSLQSRFDHLVTSLRQRSNAVLFVFNFPPPVSLDVGLADPAVEISQSMAITNANRIVADVCRKTSGAYIFDCHRLVTELGVNHWYSRRLFHMGKIPFSPGAQLALASSLARWLKAAFVPRRKCLVLDLDNTLWGGVLGEDGVAGIAVGEEYPGSVYKEFQKRLLSLRAQGVLLAIASKNNEDEVIEVFSKHPDMVLRPKDFSAIKIHWGDKAESLQEIARDLNIGVDALTFFDDSPVERAWIRERLPEVCVIEVPDNCLEYVSALEASEAFDSLTISSEDRRRAEMVHQDRQRERSLRRSSSFENFLRELNLTVEIGEVGPVTISRVVQLLMKTNQFNLTTRRHTAGYIQRLLEDRAVALWARVSDRFGDSGLTGVAIAVPQEDGRWTIDTFLLSCRVIGRHVEAVLLSELVRCVRARNGRSLIGEYVPTSKNNQVAEFYPRRGFRTVPGELNRWILDLTVDTVGAPEFIRVKRAEASEGV